MRPLRLTLENFGPFAQQTVDFSTLANDHLFLISGKTGSGKTTIFDGLCYALHGQTSGNTRSPNEMRSKFAGDKITQVSLLFAIDDVEYEITRSPEYVRESKRGTGLVKESQKTVLIKYVDGKAVDQWKKVSEVDEKIRELIGLTRQQFVQIVLLPQGDFQRFLLADSNEKEEVLRSLFHTNDYLQVAQYLKDEVKIQDKNLEKMDLTQSMLLNQMEWQGPFSKSLFLEKISAEKNIQTEFLAENQKAKEQVGLKQAAVSDAQQQLAQREKMKQLLIVEEELVQEEKTVTIWQDEVALLDRVEKAEHLFQVVEQQSTQSKMLAEKRQEEEVQQHSLEKAQETLDQEKNELASQQDEMSEIKQNLDQLISKKAQYEKVEEQTNQLQKANQALSEKKESYDNEKNALTEKEQMVVTLGKKVFPVDSFFRRQTQLQTEQFELEKVTQQVASFEKLQSALVQGEKQLASFEKELTAVQEKLATAENYFQEKNKAWAQMEISRLAEMLTDDEPCPLCGSTHHPNKAPFEAGDVELANDLKNQAAKQLANLQGQKAQVQEKITTQKNQQQEAKLQKEQLGNVLSSEELSQRREIWQKEQAQLEKDQQENKQNQQELTSTTEQLKTLQDQVQQQEETVQQETQEIKILAAQIESLKENLDAKFLTKDLRQDQEKIWQKQWTDFEGKTIENTKAWQNLQEQKIINSTQLKSLVQQQEEQTEKLQKAVADFQQQLTLQQLSQEEFKTARVKLDQRQKYQQQIADWIEKERNFQAEKKALAQEITDVPLDLLELTEQLATEKNNQMAAEEKYYQQSNRVTQLETVGEKLAQHSEKTAAAQKKRQDWQELSAVANGDRPYNISVERFILQQSFNEVVERANEKLQFLSDGRYYLRLKEEKNAARKNSGLELDVFDFHLGETRRVQTLSGGESFKAALALSLGLGEVVQEKTGGVNISLLFIDEGFGTLDEESLDLAIEALESIESKGRMIGIISHVETLKQRIYNQLMVETKGNGRSIIKSHKGGGAK
ncbi:AAA family ATPase [Enterococcus timonensis]|uniref:AAA family ATPase n=1 Tax=Enterococcus timonensis TaxID=1852364 RepID=UPI0008D97F10|nr:SMC family ATPase [Enterococcus timonensis]